MSTHADEAERIALGHLERSRKDDAEAAVMKKEQDELLQREGEACLGPWMFYPMLRGRGTEAGG